MIAVVGGLLTAVIWAGATLTSARASRIVGPWSTTGWVLLIGFVASIPLVMVDRLPGPTDTDDLVWLAYAGVGYVGGMVCNYAALATGRIGIVAPITSTEGAIAAVIAVIGGESATPLLLILLGLVAAGLVATTLEPGFRTSTVDSRDPRYLLFAGGAALLFGTSLYAAGHASAS